MSPKLQQGDSAAYCDMYVCSLLEPCDILSALQQSAYNAVSAF